MSSVHWDNPCVLGLNVNLFRRSFVLASLFLLPRSAASLKLVLHHKLVLDNATGRFGFSLRTTGFTFNTSDDNNKEGL